MFFWVGKRGFSSNIPQMQCKLKLAAKIDPDIDALLMVDICKATFTLFPQGHPLATSPLLSCTVFEPTDAILEDSIIVVGIVWLKLNSIAFHVALQQPNGEFSFGGGLFYVQGVGSWFLGYVCTNIIT